ncbi:TRAP-type C4-dicarboxylate transport system, substrate-binding protein [Oryzisolibacter propanilivorax]|uniref:TRAP-type C4-dicarboxylate transport system, substrate-binding protein n=1 Tax=Oryzisolibacter propanilivorax TaxID=1527607 RepID=A0A1G9P2H4_9BURK|nr:TRAP transporter substrate-binding protein [Oryzisolibacter propanilivorax]SDL92791.1 TRAP-type C4-dicarboxylate transport system, substrate-binding protein [Oryzisolibacter propanilivorax]
MADRHSWPAPALPPARATRRQALAALGAAAAACSPLAARAAPTTLQCAGAYADSLFHTRNLQQFARQASQSSQGAVQVEVVANAKLMPMKQVLAALGSGDLAMGEIFMSNFAQELPLLGVDSLPFIVRSFDDAKRLWNVTRQPISALLHKQGIRVLYTAPWPGQGLYARAPVNRLEDLKGQKLRVNNGATTFMAKAAGATPVDIPANNLARAIQDGEVDAMVTSSTTGVDSQSWNALGVFVDMRAWIPKNLVLMSEKRWAALPETARQALQAAASDAEARGWQLAQDADDAAQRILASHGTKITQPSYELRRSLDLLGERFARDWSGKVGVDGARVLIDYYAGAHKG